MIFMMLYFSCFSFILLICLMAGTMAMLQLDVKVGIYTHPKLCLLQLFLFSTMMYDYLIYCLNVSLTLSFAYASLRECLPHGQGSHFQEFKKKLKILPTIFSKVFLKGFKFSSKLKGNN